MRQVLSPRGHRIEPLTSDGTDREYSAGCMVLTCTLMSPIALCRCLQRSLVTHAALLLSNRSQPADWLGQ